MEIIKEIDLEFNNMSGIRELLKVNKKEFKYLLFAYSKDHYSNFTYVTKTKEEMEAYIEDRKYGVLANVVVELDPTITKNCYINYAHKKYKQMEMESKLGLMNRTDKENHKSTMDSFLNFISEEVNEVIEAVLRRKMEKAKKELLESNPKFKKLTDKLDKRLEETEAKANQARNINNVEDFKVFAETLDNGENER